MTGSPLHFTFCPSFKPSSNNESAPCQRHCSDTTALLKLRSLRSCANSSDSCRTSKAQHTACARYTDIHCTIENVHIRHKASITYFSCFNSHFEITLQRNTGTLHPCCFMLKTMKGGYAPGRKVLVSSGNLKQTCIFQAHNFLSSLNFRLLRSIHE